MPYSGMPTPDKIEPQTYRCIQVFVPDCVGDVFVSVIMGQLGEMAQEYYWKQEGDLTPQEAAFLMAQAVALTDANGIACEDAMDCNDVAACIESNITVQTAINTTIINQGIIAPNIIFPTITLGSDRLPDSDTQEIYEASEPCDLDALWAGIREIVERLDQQGRDILEDLATANDAVERVQQIIDLVPLLGDIIADVADLFTETVPDLLTAYNSFSSPASLDQVACDIFSIVCNDCRYPTYDEVLNYLATSSELGIPTFSGTTYDALWNIVKGITVSLPESVWYTINTWQGYTYAFGAEWNGNYGTKTFSVWASFGEEFANDNWIAICGGCPEPPYEIFFDFDVESAAPPNTMNAGSYIASAYWQGSNLANERLVYWSIPFGAGMLHNEVQVDYALTGAEVPSGQYFFIQGALNNQALPYHTDFQISTFPIANLAGGLVKAVGTNNRITYSTNILVRSLRFKGHGFVPAALVPYMVSGVPA